MMSTPDFPFSTIPMAPADPILGITEAYNADRNPNKTNLGVGVYYDENGKVPLLKCVQEAKKIILNSSNPHTYLPIDGLPTYTEAVQKIVFGKNCQALKDKRIITAQSLGGTGALKIGADFIRWFNPNHHVWISDPTWVNHRALFEAAGFTVHTYPYYDVKTKSINFEAMVAELNKIPAGSTLLMHACCHNPTGLDLSDDQWHTVINIVKERQLLPFLDMAYQGFSEGLDEDGRIIEHFADQCPNVFVANSYSKSFSLYGERIGALSFVAKNEDEAKRARSQIRRVIRTNYSNPQRFGAEIVMNVLTSSELYAMWDEELSHMRIRIRQMREQLAKDLTQLKNGIDFSYITKQHGLFSYSGLSADQVQRLKKEFSIYAVNSGRICVAALNDQNIKNVAKAIAQVF